MRDLDLRLGQRHAGDRALIGGLRGLAVRLRLEALLGQRKRAVVRELRLVQGRLRLLKLRLVHRQGGAGMLQLRLQRIGIELGEHLTGFHMVVVVDEHALDRAGKLARNLHLVGRLHGSGRRHGFRHGAVLRRYGDVAHRARRPAAEEDEGEAGDDCHGKHAEDDVSPRQEPPRGRFLEPEGLLHVGRSRDLLLHVHGAPFDREMSQNFANTPYASRARRTC